MVNKERIEKIVEEIKGLTLQEAAELVKRLEDILSVTVRHRPTIWPPPALR